MTLRLNAIKERESYRPIAPVCLIEDASTHFGANHPSPHMLFFYKTRSPELRAVTHVDGSARLQTVDPESNPTLCQLLASFKQVTGYGVLCNTSLNFPGRGFINRSSDLFRYARSKGIDTIVIGNSMFKPRSVEY